MLSFLSYITWTADPILAKIGPLTLRWYGLLFMSGFVLGTFVLSHIYKSERVSPRWVDVITIYMLVGTILGARLGHVLFYDPGYYLTSEHFLEIFKIWEGGLASHGATLGILGMGRNGQGIARRGAHGFGMNVIYHNRSRLDAATEAECKASFVSKEELLKTADHLVLVLPYSASSHHAIGAPELLQMKPTATLINIARGGIVDDAALAAALRNKTIAAAGLDVFEGEPAVHPELLALTNVVLTPHIASATIPTRLAMANLAADNLIGYLMHGRALTPLNTVKAAR